MTTLEIIILVPFLSSREASGAGTIQYYPVAVPVAQDHAPIPHPVSHPQQHDLTDEMYGSAG